MYGNVGAAGRLDFTVVGPAVNLAARIERLCRTLDHDVLISEGFACGCGRGTQLRSLGRHRLAGVEQAVEIYTVAALAEAA